MRMNSIKNHWRQNVKCRYAEMCTVNPAKCETCRHLMRVPHWREVKSYYEECRIPAGFSVLRRQR